MRILILLLWAIWMLQLSVLQAGCTREFGLSILDEPLANSGCSTYTIKAGDTCYAIAQTYKISLATFLSWNPGIDCDDLEIGSKVCVSSGSGGGGNGKVFREYIGAEWTGVQFTDVPINGGVEFHFILSFAIDYTNGNSPTPNNGKFSTFWDDNLSPSSVNEIKARHKNVKVMVSLGGDSVGGNQNAVFSPRSVASWVKNAVSSLTSLARQYNLDGIDIDYEHFSTTPDVFASCIGQLITRLKQNKVISVASIAPFDGVQSYYAAVWNRYSNVIDYVNFQFYTYSPSSTVAEFVGYFDRAASTYAGGKILASFSTDPGSFSSDSGGITPKNGFLRACNELKASGKLGGIFVWTADTSFTSSIKFQYETQAQAFLAA